MLGVWVASHILHFAGHFSLCAFSILSNLLHGLAVQAPSEAQRLKLKQLHWDKLKATGEDTVWRKRPRHGRPHIDFTELESLFQILETTSVAVTQKAARPEEIRLVEHRRAHNICIELSGIRKPFPEIKAALLAMDDSALSVEQLLALSRAVPDDSERQQIDAYLAGAHPRHRGVCDPARLGTVERYFVEIKDVPRLGERIQCLLFSRTYAASRSRVSRVDLQGSCSSLSACSWLPAMPFWALD